MMRAPPPERSPAEVAGLYPAPDGTVAGLVRDRARLRSDSLFLIDGERRWSWIAFEAAALRLAGGLAEAGVGSGDRIAIMAPNRVEILIIFVALSRLGAIFVPVNPDLKQDEAAYILGHAEPRLVLAAEHALDVAAAAAPGLRLLDLDGAEFAALAAAEPFLGPEASPAATCLVMYTSGTTGRPKGVMHAQRTFGLTGYGFVERMRLQPDERMLCLLPLFHVNALFYSFAGAVAAGCTLILERRFSASRFWPTVQATGATEVNLIGAIGKILGKRPRSEFVAGHALRKVYCAPLEQDVHDAFTGEFGVEEILEGYGMTEIPGVSHQPIDEPRRLGTMGRLGRLPGASAPMAEIRIVDGGGRAVAPGQAGDLLVRTPLLMQGYYQDPEATAAAVEDGWFRTGDWVRQDAEGNLVFVARNRDIIRRRGENIAGAEIDRVVGEHPDVLEAAAIPTPAELGEDDVLLAVVRRPGARPVTAEEIAAWCAARLALVKCPRFVVFVEALPHNASHKVQKFELRADPTLRARAVDLEAGPLSAAVGA